MKIHLIIILLILFLGIETFAQINLHNGGSIGIIRDEVTKPIGKNMNTFYSLVMIIICLMALFFVQRIHFQWTFGNEEVIQDITKWFFGLVLCFSMIYFLKGLIDGQSFGSQIAPIITK